MWTGVQEYRAAVADFFALAGGVRHVSEAPPPAGGMFALTRGSQRP